MPELDDEALLARWRAGERKAGATLFERHYQSVARFFAYKIGHDHDDLIQATFLGLVEGVERFEGQGSFRAFLFAIARHKLLDFLAANARDRERFDPSKTSITDCEPSPTKLIMADERRRLLVTALRRLPLNVQIMLELHYWENMKIADIAAVFELPASTVKTRMRRGRQQLEGELEALARSPKQLADTLSGLETWAARLSEEVGRSGADSGH